MASDFTWKDQKEHGNQEGKWNDDHEALTALHDDDGWAQREEEALSCIVSSPSAILFQSRPFSREFN